MLPPHGNIIYMSTAATFADFSTIDVLDTPATVDVKAANLAEGMVLVDPDLGTPLVGIDHKQRTVRSSGNVTFFVNDFETGGWRDMNLGSNTVVKVVAN